MKLIYCTLVANGEAYQAKVYWNAVTKEFIVRSYCRAKLQPAVDYFAYDKDDAINTANMLYKLMFRY